MLAVMSIPAQVSAASIGHWESVISPLLSLANTRTWILQGEKLKNGACRYQYTDALAEIPEEGWARLTIAVDPPTCRKLMEEGTPTDPDAFRAAAGVQATAQLPGSVTSRRGAWQGVAFYDIINAHLTTVTTQIYWDYNGSTVSNGGGSGLCATFLTWWANDYCLPSDSYPPGSYMVDTTAQFHSGFCIGLPVTYIYQYYNRVWGHPDGTAARAQSSDSTDECVILHNAVYAGYN